MKEFEFDPLQVAGIFASSLVPHDQEAMNQVSSNLFGISTLVPWGAMSKFLSILNFFVVFLAF